MTTIRGRRENDEKRLIREDCSIIIISRPLLFLLYYSDKYTHDCLFSPISVFTVENCSTVKKEVCHMSHINIATIPIVFSHSLSKK